MRFELIDRVLACSPDQIDAIKNVSAAEEYLGDHFPSFPILPGVMMIEVMVQAARHLIHERQDLPSGPWVVGEVRNVRYGAMVRPGESLRVQVHVRSVDTQASPPTVSFQGTGTVGDQTAVQGRFILHPLHINPPQPV